jgi:hypothetical protein
MALIETAPARTLDPLQSVLAHLPNGGYGLYEGACTFLWNDPAVPVEVKEGLRFLSASRIGCAYCRTVREKDHGGRRLLAEDFYREVAAGSEEWKQLVGEQWAPLFSLAVEVLDVGQVSPDTVERARRSLSVEQIVEGTFFMLLIGASHRFSRAFDVEETCEVPTTEHPPA